MASARRPSTLAPVHPDLAAVGAARQLGPALAAASSARRLERIGLDHAVEETGVRPRRRGRTSWRRRSRSGGGAATAAPARARPPTAAAPCRSGSRSARCGTRRCAPMRSSAPSSSSAPAATAWPVHAMTTGIARAEHPGEQLAAVGDELARRGRRSMRITLRSKPPESMPGAPVIEQRADLLLARVLGARQRGVEPRRSRRATSALALPFAIVTCAMRSRTSYWTTSSDMRGSSGDRSGVAVRTGSGASPGAAGRATRGARTPTGVAIRPRGVRSSRPHCRRNGSYTSSTVSGASPTATASVPRPDRPARERAAQRVEDRPVDLVEAELVDLEQRERVARGRERDPAVGAHLGVVADPLQQPVRDAGRAPARDAISLGAVGVELDAEDLRDPRQDRARARRRRSSRGGRRSRSGRAAGR